MNFKWLLLSLMLSVASINTMWADMYLIGSMNGWNADNWSTDYKFDGSGNLLVTLEANTHYHLRIKDNYTDRYFSGEVTGSITDYNLNSEGEGGYVYLTTSDAGVYLFKYRYDNGHKLSISFPKDRLVKQSYIYFDASNSTYWTGANFHTKFVFSYYDSGSWIEDKFWDDKFDGWVYCTPVPNNNYVGKVQLIRLDPSSNHGTQWNTSGTASASSRSTLGDNCLYVDPNNADWQNTWVPLWKTYCPPMYSASLSDNSTSTISWQTGSGTSGDPYLVPASGTIKVSAAATSKVEDDANMTKKYDFKVNTGSGASSEQDGTSSTFNKTSLSNNTTYEISVEPYNSYNGATGEKYTSATHIWYKALTMYSLTHTLSNVTRNVGRTGDNAAAYHLAYSATYVADTGYDLPSTITVMFGSTTKTAGTDYTWNQGTGVLTIPVNKIDDNVTVIINGDAETYDGTIDSDIDGGSGTDGAYTATYNETTIEITTTPSRTGYDVGGYYLNYNAEANPQYYNQIATTAGALIESTVYTDATGHWTYTGDAPTIYASWVPKTYTITLSPELSPSTGTNGSTYFTVTVGSNNYKYGEGKADEMTKPTREGYTFAGYYTSGGTQVFGANGAPNTGVSGYTAANGNWANTDDDLTLYAHWTVTRTYVFKGGASGNETSWSTAANWTKGVAPSANDGSEDIIILAPVEIPASATTNVNSVRIGSAGSYTPVGGSAIDAAGKLTIPATAMLKVTTDVKNYDFSTPSTSATTESTLHIESASTGNGALVWGASGTPGRAQVDFYTKSSAAGNWEGANTDVNQYIGTPFSNANVLYNYYNAWTFKVNDAGTAWERMKGDETMYPFVGYDVIYDGAAGHIFQMDGTLVTNANKTCTLSYTTDKAENLLANSWTAPMWIKGFEVSDFTNANAAIYIFNSTSEKATEDAGYEIDVTGGNYSAYTPGTSDAYIPSMQSFSVLSDGGGAGSVTLNYTNLVLNPWRNARSASFRRR